MSITKLFFIFSCLCCFWVTTLNAEITQNETSSLENKIEKYILENPEIIIESLRRYEKKISELSLITEKKLISDNIEKLTKDKFSYATGDKESPVTLIAFIDYKCGFCKKSLEEMVDLIANNSRIRFIIKEFPILGTESVLASKASIALFINQGPDTYKDFIQYLVKYNGKISLEKIKKIIQEIGGNSEDIEQQMEKEIVYNVLNSNYALANILKITGTPTFIIGSEIIRGYKNRIELEKIIERNYNDL